MKDSAGTMLEIGDVVVFSNGTYTSLKVAEVVGFSPKMIRLKPLTVDTHSSNSGVFLRFIYDGQPLTSFTKHPTQVARIYKSSDAKILDVLHTTAV
jgi:muramidase (phage lysozyme)